ncbi:MAG: hypothetical protein ABFS34_16055 [Gemmatimonadota bacterium]
MRGLILVLAIVSLFGQTTIAPAEAQAPSSSLVGERVRVTVGPAGPEGPSGEGAVSGAPFAASQAASTGVLIGRLVSIEADRLLLTDESGAPAEIALSDVERLELSVGQHRNMGRGALIGGLVGAAVGGVAGVIEGSKCEGDFVCFGAGGGALFGAVGGGGIGVLLGGAIGAAVKSERWSEVSSQRWGFTVQPRRGVPSGRGVEIGLRVAM